MFTSTVVQRHHIIINKYNNNYCVRNYNQYCPSNISIKIKIKIILTNIIKYVYIQKKPRK